MSQCEHWRIPLSVAASRKASDAGESSRGCHGKTAVPSGGGCFFHPGRIRILSAQAGGLCMSQCEHWRIPLSVAASRKASDAGESSRGCHGNVAESLYPRGFRLLYYITSGWQMIDRLLITPFFLTGREQPRPRNPVLRSGDKNRPLAEARGRVSSGLIRGVRAEDNGCAAARGRGP